MGGGRGVAVGFWSVGGGMLVVHSFMYCCHFWLFEVGACIFGANRKIVLLYFSFGRCWNVAIF